MKPLSLILFGLLFAAKVNAQSDRSNSPPGTTSSVTEQTIPGFAIIDLGYVGADYERWPIAVSNKLHVLFRNDDMVPAKVWHPSGEITLEADVPGNWVLATDINNDGIVVGGVENELYDPFFSTSETYAAYWPAGSATPVLFDSKALPDAETHSSRISLVNDDGYFLGRRITPDGRYWLHEGNISSGWGNKFEPVDVITCYIKYPESPNPDTLYEWDEVYNGREYYPAAMNNSGEWVGALRHYIPAYIISAYEDSPTRVEYIDGVTADFEGVYARSFYYSAENGNSVTYEPIDINDSGQVLANTEDYSLSLKDSSENHVLGTGSGGIALSDPGTDVPLRILTETDYMEQKRDPATGALLTLNSANTATYSLGAIIERSSPRLTGTPDPQWADFFPTAMSDNGVFIVGMATNQATGQDHAVVLMQVELEIIAPEPAYEGGSVVFVGNNFDTLVPQIIDDENSVTLSLRMDSELKQSILNSLSFEVWMAEESDPDVLEKGSISTVDFLASNGEEPIRYLAPDEVRDDKCEDLDILKERRFKVVAKWGGQEIVASNLITVSSRFRYIWEYSDPENQRASRAIAHVGYKYQLSGTIPSYDETRPEYGITWPLTGTINVGPLALQGGENVLASTWIHENVHASETVAYRTSMSWGREAYDSAIANGTPLSGLSSWDKGNIEIWALGELDAYYAEVDNFSHTCLSSSEQNVVASAISDFQYILSQVQ